MNNSFDNDQPKAYHHGDLRNALIRAGLEMLAEGGAAALDLRKVARKAGVSHAAPYRHFADKQTLIAAIIEIGFQRLTEHMRSTLHNMPTNVEAQLQGLAQGYVSFAQSNPWLMREMFSGLTIEREAFPAVHQTAKGVYQLFVDVVRAGQAQARIREGDPGELASVIWSMLHGMATLIIENQTRPYTDTPIGVERMIHMCTQMLYEGLGGM
ncbi:TetR/AcrR family transcriptional regulator [Leptolyngbya sp. FACHB-671]|uniref:TetR/AcrR family transcriptional regulator n=1 Tax=Leptolyngbya sp. FACHB-671 TaxID=2692812 RepID=UPI00168240F2|nr:TetR/AcrR family transcriptional regulator [Leptolyngbya sp. FACHB-671]MBD2066122.1 TetR/AcrR family transcriptional regulator [Leptolyngbya sp. FACHB-671]